MFSMKAENVFRILDNFLYIGLASLGCYLIYHGAVISKFEHKRTNFAEYNEPITELPIFVTRVRQTQGVSTNLNFGENYWIFFGENILPGTEYKNLSQGENSLNGLGLKLEIKNGYWGQHRLKITPYNVSDEYLGTGKKIQLTFKFENHSLVSQVGISLSSRNNSHCGMGSTSHDGLPSYVHAKPGEKNKVYLNNEKYVFSSDIEPCRNKPYNDIIVERIIKQMENNCSKICRDKRFWICNPDLEKVLPICASITGLRCFVQAKHLAEKNAPLPKPCTKLHYTLTESLYPQSRHPDEVRFELLQTIPPRVTVKEEYLVYDLVSMIGAIGGTMGLCIGLTYNVVLRIGDGFGKLRVFFSKIIQSTWRKSTPVLVIERETLQFDSSRTVDPFDQKILQMEKLTCESFDSLFSRLTEIEKKEKLTQEAFENLMSRLDEIESKMTINQLPIQ